MEKLNRRTYLRTASIATVGMIGLAGCGDSDTATGTLATQVTDQPGDITDFESCVVTIAGMWVKPATEEDTDVNETDTNETQDGEVVDPVEEEDIDQSEAREYMEFEEPQAVDLVELQAGESELIDERELAVDTYEFIQLEVTEVEAVLMGGEQANVDTPGNAPLQFKHPFEIREDQTTTFIGDFTPVKRGQTGSYLLQPVATGTQVEYEGTAEE